MVEVHATALDHEFVVRAPQPLADVVEATLAPIAAKPSEAVGVERIEIRSNDDARWVMCVDGVDAAPMSSARVVAYLLEHINRRAADSVEVGVPLHAAAVAHPDGGVVALAGSSGSGKSTLGAAAVRAGWGFVAEEVAAVNPDDREVRPYHRPIGLRAGGAAAVGVAIPDADWFAEVYPWPVPVEARRRGGRLLAIALVQRSDGGCEAADVRPSQALAELVEHTVVPSHDRIVPVFRALDRLVREVPVVRLSVGDPSGTVELLDRLVGTWRV
jgi:hypothetical protein